jgi:hypothetical protein
MTDVHVVMAGAVVVVTLLFAVIGGERHWCRTPCGEQRRADRKTVRRRKRVEGHLREMARSPRKITLARMVKAQRS